MKQTMRLLASVSAIAMFLMQPARASANCVGGLSPKPLAYQSGGATSVPRHVPGNPFEPTFKNGPEHAVIVGLWKVTLTSGGEVVDVGFDAWHSDGTEILNDVSPISHNVCLGTWIQIGPRTFRLKHMVLRFDATGNLIGTAILRETNVVNPAGNVFTGTFTLEFLDLEGNSVFTASGEITGERVTVD